MAIRTRETSTLLRPSASPLRPTGSPVATNGGTPTQSPTPTGVQQPPSPDLAEPTSKTIGTNEGAMTPPPPSFPSPQPKVPAPAPIAPVKPGESVASAPLAPAPIRPVAPPPPVTAAPPAPTAAAAPTRPSASGFGALPTGPAASPTAWTPGMEPPPGYQVENKGSRSERLVPTPDLGAGLFPGEMPSSDPDGDGIPGQPAPGTPGRRPISLADLFSSLLGRRPSLPSRPAAPAPEGGNAAPISPAPPGSIITRTAPETGGPTPGGSGRQPPPPDPIADLFSRINPQNDLRDKIIAPGSNERLDNRAAMADEALSSLAGIDRFKLAQDKFRDYSSATEDEYNFANRVATQRAAAGGRTGSGMLRTDYGNLDLARARDLDRMRSQLFNEALEGSIDDTFRKSGALNEAERDLDMRGRADREEFRGERGHQDDLERQAFERSRQSVFDEDALTNSRFNRDYVRSSFGFAGNPGRDEIDVASGRREDATRQAEAIAELFGMLGFAGGQGGAGGPGGASSTLPNGQPNGAAPYGGDGWLDTLFGILKPRDVQVGTAPSSNARYR